MMKFATRINSFLSHGLDLSEAFASIAEVQPGAYVDLNYPEHIHQAADRDISSLLATHGLALNGMAIRYRSEFVSGEFTDSRNRSNALDVAKRTVDAIGELGGSVLTLWLSYDGNDYRFQDDYERSWERVLSAVSEIADYASGLQLSLESKPYEPRSCSLLPSTVHTLHLIDEIDRDNVGVTLDFCHTLMAGENPSSSLALVLRKRRLFGVHLNDGYGNLDDGLMFGSVDPARAAEFVYYLKRGGYDGVIYFDTFPVREDPGREFRTNIATFQRLSEKLEAFGMGNIQRVIDARDGLESLELLGRLFY